MRNLDPSRQRWVRGRIALLTALFLIGAGAILRRAYELQIVRGDEFRREATAQQLRDIRLAPKRGTIYDRHGAELAVSVEVESVYANPREMRRRQVDVEVAATRLAAVLGIPRERVAQRLRADRYFVWIERQVTPEEAAAVRALAIPGVALTRESRRFYPNRELASHVLGFVDVDGVGIEGIELRMDERLRGSTETVPAMVDRRGRVVFSEQLLDDRALMGDDVYLTIDKTIQHIAERELALAVRTFEAQAGSIVVMDPASGDLYAIANVPNYDPNDPGKSPVAHRRNRAITDRFEPGSTIKPFTVAAALAAGTLRADSLIDCNGNQARGRKLTIDVEGHTIGEADGHQPMGLLTPAQLLARSSNIGAARIGIGLGRSGLYRALRRFGFGAPTGVALPGETGGILRHHRHWYDLDLASISFGQGLSVTTLQLAAAYAAIANGGRLVRPQIVRRIVDARGEIVEESAPEIVRQVVPRSTARLVADMLTAVTSAEGTGLEAAIDGYVVAGKTGTAQKADDDHGGYRRDAYTASFVGFVPAEAPRLVIAVVIDEPVIGHYGGMVAGPVFRRVGEAALRHLGVPPSGSGEALADIGRAVRTRSGTRRQAREQEEADPGFRADSAGPGPVEGGVRVPDLRGATARRAVLALTRAGLQPSLEGTGLVVAQAPEAGTIVPAASRVWVVLEAPSWQEPTLAADEADGEMSGDGDPGTHAVVGATAALAAAAPSRGGRR